MSWQHILGHERQAAAFARAAARGRLAHAYLFVGPSGVGKRMFARQLARTLLCETPPAGVWDSCDQCPACHLVDAGTHPDLFEVARPDEKLELPIEVAQELCAALTLKPARGGRKVAVIDDADDLNDESANCFLKTLEEPPPGSILILIGTSAELQLPTIRSRCQVVPFASLPTTVVADLLAGCEEIEAESIPRLARLGGGSVGLARDLADPALWAFRTRALETLARPKPDIPALSQEWQELLEGAGKEAGRQRRRAALVLRLLVNGFRDALRSAVGAGDTAPTDTSASDLASRFGADGLMQRLERCLDADLQIDRRAQLVLVLEGLLDSVA